MSDLSDVSAKSEGSRIMLTELIAVPVHLDSEALTQRLSMFAFTIFALAPTSTLIKVIAASFGRSVRTFDQLEYGNVGVFQPRLQRVAADRTVCVTGVWHQELFFSASVLGAAIGTSDNRRHSGNMRSKPYFFQRNAGTQVLARFDP
jgi:hypothetical protein